MSANLRTEIEAVLADWAWHLDHRDFDAVAGLFTSDAELTVGGTVLRGRAAIRERYTGRAGVRTTRHTCGVLRVTAVGEAGATAASTWVCWAANRAEPADDLGAYLVADFHDHLERGADGRWLIRKRRIVPVLRDATRAPVVS